MDGIQYQTDSVCFYALSYGTYFMNTFLQIADTYADCGITKEFKKKLFF